MTTEEKAKAYDEAINQAKKELQACGSLNCDAARQIFRLFPELAESEDERIKNEILLYIGSNQDIDLETHNRWCSYLEKQKEGRRNITANLLEDGITGVQRELIEFLANNIDASWVDVVKSADAYAQRIRSMVEKQKGKMTAEEFESSELFQLKLKTKYANGYQDGLAQKEQKPLSTEETELNSIAFLEQLGYTCVPPGAEPKPAEWSEEDMGFLYEVMTMVQSRGGWVRSDDAIENVKSWLNALPERFNLQPKQEWSENDEKIRQSIIKDIEFDRNYTYATTGKVIEKYNEQINWLKVLSLNRKKRNENIAKLCSNEWSEEDEKNLRNLESVLYYAKGLPDETRTELGNFLKSLRPSWKPSEHQITILKAVKNYVGVGSGYWGEALGSLIEDLEKL